MAKKSARGRVTLLEMTRETDKPVRKNDAGETVPSDLVSWERTTVTLMSDGTILKKEDAKFLPGPYDNGVHRAHTWGWKVFGKVKEGVTPARFREAYEKLGYKVKA